MTNEELEAKIQGTIRRLTEIEHELLGVARQMPELMKDSGMTYAAEDVERLFIEYDSLTEDARMMAIDNLSRLNLDLALVKKGKE